MAARPSLRSLPRIFVPGALAEFPIDLPDEDVNKLRKVLRLSSGAEIAVLPNDGSVVRCTFQGHQAIPFDVARPETEPTMRLTLAQALPKGDKLDEIVRANTELGVSRFLFFPSDRSVVQWDQKKTADRMRRLEKIGRESAEVCFRTRLPQFELRSDLADVLKREPDAVVLSEAEDAMPVLSRSANSLTIVVGPEGGWTPQERQQIGSRGVTLGPRVLRVEHAGAAAAAILLLRHSEY